MTHPFGTIVIDYDGETLMSLGLPAGVGPADEVGPIGVAFGACWIRIGYEPGGLKSSATRMVIRRPPDNYIDVHDGDRKRYVIQKETL